MILSACASSDKETGNQVVENNNSSMDGESGNDESTSDDEASKDDESSQNGDSSNEEQTTSGDETSKDDESSDVGGSTQKPSEEETTTSSQQAACTHSYGEWKVTTAATCAKEGAKQRTCTKCSHKETSTVPTIAHKEVKDAAVAATCTTPGKTEGKHCSVCKKVIVAQQTVKALGHKEVTINGTLPTDTASGLSSGKKCSTCGNITVAQVVIAPYLESCNDDYGYKDLAKQSSGTAKQTMYTRMDEKAKAFHSSSTLNAKDNIAFSVAYSDLGLTIDDAVQVWITYKNDHPLFYWMSVSINYDDSQIHILTDSAYASGASRASYNSMIYKKIAEYCQLTANETSEYMIALAYHDAIIEAIDYAYEADGVTPEDAEWAHNILGVFEKGSGVCESYARTYQLMLNVRGVENIFVSGTGGNEESGFETHAWNLVKMDDDKWYWCDLTWDDSPDWEWGILYNNFCVNDTQNVNWSDGAEVYENKTFVSQHKAGQSMDNAPVQKVTLPARSGSKFTSKTVQVVRDKFKVDDVNYSVSGYNTVQLLNAIKSGVYEIPETVNYNGRTYTVISIGDIFESSGYYGAGYCFNQLSDKVITKLVVPKTVKFIWDFALAGNIEAIEVDKANPYFTSVDGVLFTKSMYTLIQYPYAKPKVDKYVIPDATRDIANNAFVGVKYGFDELVIGKNVDGIGQANWGAGYHDEKPTGFFGGNYVSGELGELIENYLFANKKLKITVAAGNTKYKSEGGVIYSEWISEITGATERLAECLSNTEVTAIVFADTTVRVDSFLLTESSKVTSVTINKGMQQLFTYAFFVTDKLKIKYNGTVSEWNKIDKGDYWDHYDISVRAGVQCSDGIGY